jgi:2-oxoglutarate ferredoxin oxidoreductase subunit alpha
MTNTMERNKKHLLQGNEAIVEGALAAGCRFFAGYPITPSTEIAEAMSQRLPRLGGTFIQMEDELASMGAIIGASLAGVKAMTATSGPGFSLMQENIGYACMTEVPVVVVNVMRGGPSTGMPTSPAQSDVMQARWGTHGDHGVIVMAVSSVSDSYEITVHAFNLSEKYRVPVILLSDEIVGHTREVITLPPNKTMAVFNRIKPNVPPEWYEPYEDNSRGVPPMAAIGSGYRHHVTGLMHDTKGFPCFRPEVVKAFHKRMIRKLANGAGDIQMTKAYMLEDAEVAIITFGAVSRSAIRAVKMARARGIKAGFLQLVTLFPFPKMAVDAVLRQCRAVLVPEMNMGQIVREVRAVNQTAILKQLNRFDGLMITPDQIFTKIITM